MKFSRNPKSGILESYTDDGEYLGEVYTFEDYVFEKEERKKRPFNMDMIEKMQLVSRNVGYGPCPKPEDEVEQRLTITDRGRAYLSRYRFGKGFGEHELIEKRCLSISSEDAGRILTEISKYFSNGFSEKHVTDIGTWELTLTDDFGHKHTAKGSLWEGTTGALDDLSELIRTKLGIEDLFAFDGTEQ